MVLSIPIIQRSAASGFVVRNSTGHSIIAMARNLEFSKILMAEAMALRDGLLAVPSPTQKSLIVEGDSKTLIDALTGKIGIPWKIKFLVFDILALACQFLSLSFHHILREANFITDSLANLGRSASPFLSWCNRLPLFSSTGF